MTRLVVVMLEKVDEVIDAVAYRPAVVKAFASLPWWWHCGLAKLSVRLDDRWGTGYWADGPVPSGTCAACERRAAHLVIDGPVGEVPLCGWCRIEGSILSEADLERALAAAAARSVSWRWR
jgi:hypothetical protein